MGPKLERLTYVYEERPGKLGELIRRLGNRLRFGSEGSGLFEVGTHPGAGTPVGDGPVEEVVPITASPIEDLLPELRDAVRGHTPCILGHAEGQSAILVGANAVQRLNGTASDLRGKVRFGLARVEWTLR